MAAPRPAPEASPGELPVAVDAMGGDHAPGEIVAGARRAARDFGIPVVLVGPPELVGDTGGLEVIAASEVIAMDEDPASSVRRKKDSSLVRAAEAVRDGRASAMVSAGNTGATMASALLRMGRLKGVARPAIATPIPQLGSHPTVLLDAGANAECTAAMLVQFAQMGTAYSSARYGAEKPTVALLSIGEERSKGSSLIKETHALLEEAPGVDFVGNLEGRDLLHAGVDVVVTDGFTGNIVLKLLEGTIKELFATLREEIAATPRGKLGALLIRPAARRLRTRLDPDTYGGAYLLGLHGLAVIAHGNSGRRAIANAIRLAGRGAERRVVERLAEKLPERARTTA
jgi:glycerol-3-phosphate acyltransferase PlsX